MESRNVQVLNTADLGSLCFWRLGHWRDFTSQNCETILSADSIKTNLANICMNGYSQIIFKLWRSLASIGSSQRLHAYRAEEVLTQIMVFSNQMGAPFMPESEGASASMHPTSRLSDWRSMSADFCQKIHTNGMISLFLKTLPILHQFLKFNMKRKADTEANGQNGKSILKKRAKTSMAPILNFPLSLIRV
jgi:hypothetical protein